MNRAMKIIIGYDGSDCAETALNDLGRAGIPDGSEIRVVSVSEWFPAPASLGGAEGLAITATRLSDDQAMAAELAERGAEILRTNHPAWNVVAEGCIGSPAYEVLRRAEEWEADLIVVGSHGRGAMGRLLLGSVSQQMIQARGSSVRIARKTEESRLDQPPVLLLALDGSDYSEVVTNALLRRSWPTGTSVHVVSAAEFSYNEEEEIAILDRLKNLHDGIVARLHEHNLNPHSLIDTKMVHPKRLILGTAEQHHVDTIFLGARGLTGFERFILGSVSTAVAMQARCSVEIVHD